MPPAVQLMTYIEKHSSPTKKRTGIDFPTAVVQTHTVLVPGATVQQQIKTLIVCETPIVADGEVLIEAIALIVCETPIVALGRIGAEANVFGGTLIVCETPIVADGIKRSGAQVVINCQTIVEPNARVAVAGFGNLKIFLTVGEFAGPGFGATYSARVKADGVFYSIRGLNYNEDAATFGKSASFVMQKPGDRAAILAASSFEIQIYDRTAWRTMFSSGVRSGANWAHSIVDPGRPNDALSVQTIDASAAKLDRSPQEPITIYDPFRLTLTADQFTTIYDTDGGDYVQQLIPIGSLDLDALFHKVLIDYCGFTDYETNIQSFPIRQANAGITGTYFDALKGHIGVIEPLVFERNDTVFIIDSTVAFPASVGDPIALTSDMFRRFDVRQTEQNIDGYILQFSERESDHDYTQDREVEDDPEEFGTEGDPDYIRTVTTHKWKDYFKFSQPFSPVKKELVGRIVETFAMIDGVLTSTETETETITIDSLGRTEKISIKKTGLVPDVQFGSFAGSYPLILATIRTQIKTFEYKNDPKNPRKYYQSKAVEKIDGLCIIDSENEHLGKSWIQEFNLANLGGNLKEGQTVESRAIEKTIEKADFNEKGQIEFRSRTWRFTTTPPTVQNQPTDVRDGEIGGNQQTSSTVERIVLRPGASKTNAKLVPLGVAEIPQDQAIAFARRKLELTPRDGTIELVGLYLILGKGVIFEVFNRDGLTLGRYIVEGRSISMQELGTPRQSSTMALQIRGI